MELELTDTAKEDIKYFVKSGQIHIVKKIEKLLASIKETPFTGIVKNPHESEPPIRSN
jgi:Txe/YoeB family toxin of Txe-Axe toxin-antitoxin module